MKTGNNINSSAKFLSGKETGLDKYKNQLNRLRFQEAIESTYLQNNFDGFLLSLRISVLFALLVNLGFYMVDRQIAELVSHLEWVNLWRYGVATPTFVTVGFLTLFVRSDLALNLVASVGIIVAGLFVLAIAIPIPDVVKSYYWTGLTIILLYPLLLMRMRYRYAVVSSSIVFLMFVIGGRSVIGMSAGSYISAFGVLATALVMGVAGGYVLERYRRRDFLQRYLTSQTVNELQRSNIKLESLSHMDALTDIPNRRYFDSSFEREWSRCRRSKLSISLLLVDIDRFKDYNDSYGHPAGDHVLKQVAKCLQQAIRRPSDFVARYGGEEFAVVLADTDETGMQKTGERILEDVRNLHISHEYRESGEEPYITVSVGAATMVPEDQGNLDLLVGQADQALYDAKKAGRNKLVASSQDEAAVS